VASALFPLAARPRARAQRSAGHYAAGDIAFLETLDDATAWTAQKALLRGPVHAPPLSPQVIARFDAKPLTRNTQ
jgi:hypothetical protein